MSKCLLLRGLLFLQRKINLCNMIKFSMECLIVWWNKYFLPKQHILFLYVKGIIYVCPSLPISCCEVVIGYAKIKPGPTEPMFISHPCTVGISPFKIDIHSESYAICFLLGAESSQGLAALSIIYGPTLFFPPISLNYWLDPEPKIQMMINLRAFMT